ncbi:hypothetical protein [Pseudomonas protegens]|jgi:hypothetical protein|nr:hypothetical protein [Pseudomonas protegens]MCD9571769.1 hypothetical protein [Pseudomonas protegens]WRV92124.1 hypothetical protein VP719_03560 [Pseudomonas protegens]
MDITSGERFIALAGSGTYLSIALNNGFLNRRMQFQKFLMRNWESS